MDPSLKLSYPEDLSVSSLDDGEMVLQSRDYRCNLGVPHPATRAIVERLVSPGTPLGGLIESAKQTRYKHAIAYLYHFLQLLAKRGLLRIIATDGDQSLATLIPVSGSVCLAAQSVRADRPMALSRFAYLRNSSQGVVVESPRSAARVVLHHPQLAAVLMSLARPKTADAIEALADGFSPDAIQRVLQLLRAATMVLDVDDNGMTDEQSNPELRAWEFHDLLFHARSRQGRHGEPVGATFATSATDDAPPVAKPCNSGQVIALYQPDLQRLADTDPTFTQVMEHRCSIRHYGAAPLTVEQLGEFLYRIARIKHEYSVDCATPFGEAQMQLSARPYPSGGALYPLEFYPIVCRCQGIEAGLYHYDPRGHRLYGLSPITETVEQLVLNAGYATGIRRDDLQVLLITTARFRRVSWKYSTLAYSLILKEVGIAMQNMYLAATAMHLAPCAIGSGNSDLFAEAISSDYYAETSVGEFVLGSYPDMVDEPEQLQRTLHNKKAVLGVHW